MTSEEAARFYAEVCKLWPRSPRSEFIDARRLDRLERLWVNGDGGVSGYERCGMALAAFYEEQMSESKTPRSTIPFDALMRRLQNLDPQPVVKAEPEADPVEENPMTLPQLVRWYEAASERADLRAKEAKPGPHIGTPGFWRWLSSTCKNRAALCRQRMGTGVAQ